MTNEQKPSNPPALTLEERMENLVINSIMSMSDEEVMEGVTEEEIEHLRSVVDKAIEKAAAIRKARES